MESLILIAQIMVIALLAGWLVLGALENLRAPNVNGDIVAEVLSMERVRQYPQIYEAVSRNRIEDPRIHRLLFRLIVAAECLVAVLLVLGTFALILALLGILDADLARMVAMPGAMGFAGIWGGFLVGGQWFHYWAGTESAQTTHLLLLLWGTGAMIFLSV